MRYTTFCILCLAFICSCSKTNNKSVIPPPDSPIASFAKGADLSWLTEQEHDSVLFYDETGNAKECISLLRKEGMNAVRLRVWVNHNTGWCNKDDVLEKAERAVLLGQRLMIDLHYSDYFADPAHQSIPHAWKDYDLEQMKTAVTQHTIDVLTALKQKGIPVEWVQVGNETTNGMLWPMGKITNEDGSYNESNWNNYAQLTTAGYDAVKSVYPDAIVIVHIDNAYQLRTDFFSHLIKYGGKFDMIGLSHYPMMTQWSGKSWQEMNNLAIQNLLILAQEFNCKVMISEIGIINDQFDKLQEAQVVMHDFVSRINQINQCAGIFYWEPQCYGGWKPKEYEALNWGAYNQGAFTTDGKVSKALKELLN